MVRKRKTMPKVSSVVEASISAKDKIKGFLSFTTMIPNLVTLLALSCGVSAMRWAVMGKWDFAALFIILAAVFDGLDGRIARMLDATSKFGAELDSLSDFVSFGVAPAFVMYMWSLSVFPKIGWMLALLLSICCALRLARFNTMLEEEPRAHYWDYFFVGLPAPGGAMVAIAPLMLYLDTGNDFFNTPWLVGMFVFVAAVLMASRVPTICVKKVKIRAKDAPFFLVLVAVYLGFLLTQFWLVMSVTTIVYLAIVPFGLLLFYKMKKKHEE